LELSFKPTFVTVSNAVVLGFLSLICSVLFSWGYGFFEVLFCLILSFLIIYWVIILPSKKKKKKNLFLGLFLLFQLCFMETIWFSFWDSVANSIAVDPGF